MIKDPRVSVWLRITGVVLIFFVLHVALGSQPIRSRTVDLDKVLVQSTEMVFLGPALPIFLVTQSFGAIAAGGFWLALIVSAMGSQDPGPRRWSYGLLVMYVVMSSLGILLGFGIGLISMAHAI